MNFRSTISIFLLLTNSSTSFGVMSSSLSMVRPMRSGSYSNGVVPALARSDPDDFLHVRHEDLPVPDPAGAGGFLHRLHHLGYQVVGHDDFQLDLGEEVDHVFGAPVELGVPLLAAEPLDLGNGHAVDPDVVQGLLDLIQLERLDDRLDLLHGSPPRSGNQSNGRTNSVVGSLFPRPGRKSPVVSMRSPGRRPPAVASPRSRW